MATRRSPSVLHDSDLALALSRIPWTLVEAVKGRAREFVFEKLRDPTATDAAIIRKLRCSTKVPGQPAVKAALAAAFAVQAAKAAIDGEYLMGKVKTAIEGAEAGAEWSAMTGALSLAGKWVRFGEKDPETEDAEAKARKVRAMLEAMDAATVQA